MLSPAEQRTERWWLTALERVFTSFSGWCAICLVWAAVLVCGALYQLNPDGMSYLDMASQALHEGPGRLVNGYWSPGYPVLLAAALFVFRPLPAAEFPVIHLVNLLTFALSLWAFAFFLRGWLAITSGEDEQPALIPFAFGVFLWCTMTFISVGQITPDLCVAATVFLAAGIICRLPGAGFRSYLTLGVVLGLGYYVKAAMLPVGVLLLALLFVWPPAATVSRKKLLAAGLILLLVSAPLIALTSRQVGHLTISDTGRLNYVWFAGHRELLTDGLPGGKFGDSYGSLTHPPAILMDRPLTYDFRSHLSGTFPLWHDPSYWWTGLLSHFDLHQQMEALADNVRVYRDAFFQMAALVVGALVLLAQAMRSGKGVLVPRPYLWVMAWCVAAFSMFGAVHMRTRYVGMFFVLFWVAVYGLLAARVERRVRTAVLGVVVCALLLPEVLHFGSWAKDAFHQLRHKHLYSYELVGERLHALGVGEGARVAIVDAGFDAVWARYARTRIAVEISDAGGFWNLNRDERKVVEERLRGVGVAAIVGRDRPPGALADGWQDVPTGLGQFSILPLAAGDAARE